MTDMPPVAILCGGKGTRLGGLTKNTPKSLVRVAGKPFIFHQFDLLKKQGVKKVVLCVGHLGSQIRETVGMGYAGLDIDYSFDGDEPLGTMGAIRKAAPKLGNEFVTLYGDSYLLGSLRLFVEAARESKKPIAQAMWKGVDYGYAYFSHPWQTSQLKVGGIGDLHDLRVCHEHDMADRFYQIGDPEGLSEVEALLAPKVLPPITTPGDRFVSSFMWDVITAAHKFHKDTGSVEAMVSELVALRERGGRLFILGLGGSAANASHAVNDFRKLCEIEAYAPTDNVAELTARANDEAWEDIFSTWLVGSRLCNKDAILILSVGGGTEDVSIPLGFAINHAKAVRARVLGIVGRDGGTTAKRADCCVIIPTVNEGLVTPIAESMQAVIWHLLVSHPLLAKNKTKW